jgi:DNA-binding transcriptional MocR family regulator
MLPPQRELADFLDLNLSTVTRAYKVCELKGLIYASVGKGTFVSPNINLPNVVENHSQLAPVIEMGVIKPFYDTNSIVLETISALTKKNGAAALLEYSHPLGTPFQKQNAQKWLAGSGVQAALDNILIASGAQNALTIALVSLFKPGDKIATDVFTHPNFISLANMLNIQLVPVAGDTSGMLPDALEAACISNKIAGLYLMPCFSNPTNITMPNKRRGELANIINSRSLTVIEDEVYAFWAPPDCVPLFHLAPDHTVYTCSTSKSICAGLRVAFMACSPRFRTRLISGIYNINLKTSSLNTEIVAELIHNGTAQLIVNKKIELAQERNQLFNHIWGPVDTEQSSTGFFRWLALPDSLNGLLFEKLAQAAGVHLFSSDRFAVGETPGQSFIRLAISSPEDHRELDRGLRIVKSLLQNPGTILEEPDFIV